MKIEVEHKPYKLAGEGPLDEWI